MPIPLGVELPTRLRDLVGRELGPGERLIWLGQPDPSRTVKLCLPIVFFGIPWTAFSLFWTYMAAGGVHGFAERGGSPMTWLFPMFGLPFVAIGFGMLSAPYFARRTARNTAYVLTNHRIFFLTHSGKGTTVQNYQPERNDMERREFADGSGDFTFLRREGRDSDGDRTVEKIQLIGIPDVRQVEGLIQSTFFGAAPPYGTENVSVSVMPTVDVPLPETATIGAPGWYRSRYGVDR